MTSDRIATYFQKASKYGMLADYYKYQNPSLHMQGEWSKINSIIGS